MEAGSEGGRAKGMNLARPPRRTLMVVAGLFCLLGYALFGSSSAVEAGELSAEEVLDPTPHKGAVHLGGTDFPWQREANVYILGHRQGYPGTRSHLLFHDLSKLHNGDEVFLIDANGTRYTYEVFREFVAEPYEVQVTQPIPGKSVVSLQSCTLPEYSKRLIVRAELKDVS